MRLPRPPSDPAAALELVALACGYGRGPTGRAVARIATALAMALRDDDLAALEQRHGPDAWARKYAGGRGGTSLGASDRRLDQVETLRELVAMFEGHTEQRHGFKSRGWLSSLARRERDCVSASEVDDARFPVALAAALMLTEQSHRLPGVTAPATVAEGRERAARIVKAFRSYPRTAEGFARAALRGFTGWSAADVDDAFRKV